MASQPVEYRTMVASSLWVHEVIRWGGDDFTIFEFVRSRDKNEITFKAVRVTRSVQHVNGLERTVPANHPVLVKIDPTRDHIPQPKSVHDF